MAVKDILIAMEQIGFTDVILPFILIFTVLFAVLQKSKILGSDRKGNPKANYNAMVALVIAFFVLAMVNTLAVITWITRYIAILMIAFFFLALIFALLGVREHHKNTLMFIALMLLIFVFFQVAAWTGVIDPDFLRSFILPIFVVIFLIGLVAIMLRSKPGEAKASSKTNKIEVPGLEHEKEIKPEVKKSEDRSKEKKE